MSAETLAKLLDAFERGDLNAAAACFSDDAEYREARKPPVCGRQAIAEHFARFAATKPAWGFAADEVRTSGPHACVVYRFWAGGDGEPRRERAGCATVRFDDHGQISEWREDER